MGVAIGNNRVCDDLHGPEFFRGVFDDGAVAVDHCGAVI